MKTKNPIRKFIKEILVPYCKSNNMNYEEVYEKSELLQYINFKTGAIDGDSKTRRSLANIYGIYSLLHYYYKEYYNNKKVYQQFDGFEYTKLFLFYRKLYGGEKLQNHALNSRINLEFKNKFSDPSNPDLISTHERKYFLNIEYLYVDTHDISNLLIQVIKQYIQLLEEKDKALETILNEIRASTDINQKKERIAQLLEDKAEARIFEIISYAILRNHYSQIKVYIGYSLCKLRQEYLTLYKTGRTNANDGGIDFVMRPLGRFFQVTEVDSYDKYLLDIDKVLHFPITFLIKTEKTKELIENELSQYIEVKSGGMEKIKERYSRAIEEIITINELKRWLSDLDENSINTLINDIDYTYKIEFNLV